ncbi:WD40 repeat-like protein [Obba rivulosa]|uniref:DNA damage-binding protein CMR1 n=1 Tax=Obba rivulosa TaxID=1052685 RepID=A0A8E2J5I3_9APHY|nr:WD40 repeat-like protein [Obba rivulosa]
MSDSDASDYELEREANIARNREILAQLDMDMPTIPIPIKRKEAPSTKAKPIQPSKKAKREKTTPVAPTRQSARLRKTVADPNESPSKKRKREQEEERQRKTEEEERLEAEERAREAKRPRHQDLDLPILIQDMDVDEIPSLRTTLEAVTQEKYPKRTAEKEAFVFNEDDKKEEAIISELKEKFQCLKVVSRAKVTQDRIYSAAYHPEPTKDLIFFGDKHGQLGIWDARAASDEAADEDGDVTASDDREGGRYWRLQVHWPATSKSSISTVKLDPVNAHSVYTSAYDCTIRSLSFESGISREIYSTEDALISSIDLPPDGNEMWISDALGGLTHLDLREEKSKARWYQVSDQKVGSVSVNPTNPHYLVTASNSRALRIWDARRLENIAVQSAPSSSRHDRDQPFEFENSVVEEYIASPKGKAVMRAEWKHNKSVSSAYWDARGRSVVSTSYDDNIRLWEFNSSVLGRDSVFPSSRPFKQIRHNCQTGKWLTILKAQWTPNPDTYPHFTIGNMEHSLDIFSCKGDLLARLSDRQRITAVQAVTCSHPSVVERAASGNASGRCILWAPPGE